MDFSEYDDAQLDRLRREVVTEQERRANLARIPSQVADLCDRFRSGGGDQETLEKAINGDRATGR